MTGKAEPSQESNPEQTQSAAYSAEDDLVDFILGITFEIWEQGQVEFIHDYYGKEVEVYSLDGMTNGATRMVENTYKTLDSYPDRLLLADDVITTGTTRQGFSSHRLVSPMTNKGDTVFGPATGQYIYAMNIADCEVNDGLITREWLVRDNLAVVRQLGFEPLECAKTIAGHFDQKQSTWLASEFKRTGSNQPSSFMTDETSELYAFAGKILGQCWQGGDMAALNQFYAPYCVLHRAPLQRYSGREATLDHYGDWRRALPNAELSIDHVCSQPFDTNSQRIAVRWSVAAHHQGELAGQPGTGKPVYIMGVTHWHLVEGRIAAEWTIFDELAVLAQTLV
ncbi:MAG: ester cyclase [Gammaproteobacteria bacterium]|nr:ester cyclase [Gammaproteobacteria bacterium]